MNKKIAPANNAEAEVVLRQDEMRSRVEKEGTGSWTVVWDSWRDDESSGGAYAAFASPDFRDHVLSSARWDLMKGDGRPGFSKSSEGGAPVTKYERYAHGDSVKPIIICQKMHGVVPDALLVSEEFRLLMNLWEDKGTGNYFSINDDGSKDLGIEVSPQTIRIRTPLLRRYQAAMQLDLLLFVDSIRYVRGFSNEKDFESLREDDHVINGGTVIFVGIGGSDNRVFSRVLTTKVLPAPPQEQSGIWPWNEPDTNYPDFIIGEDDAGNPICFSCDPEGTADYFDKNPNAPHYLTPVFFRKEVLKRYYDDPDLYSVDDGTLRCARAWSVQIDNHNSEIVMVFLGDLGRDLPSTHRDHWRAQNIPPVSEMSQTTYRRSFLGQFSDSPNPEHIFKNAYMNLQKVWTEAFGWGLYKEPNGSDKQVIQRVRIPLNETDTEFEEQVLALCKLMVELLNEREISQNLTKVKNERGISKLERFLTGDGYAYVDRDVAFLRRLQNLRSKSAAHAKGSDYAQLLTKELNGGSRTDLVTELMRDATQMLDDLATLRLDTGE